MTDSTITPTELQHLLSTDAEVHLIDVRTGAEYESAHIPGSYHVPLDTLSEHRDELTRHLEQPVVLICQSGGRATQASEHLAETGLSNVRVLVGGMGSWVASGGQVNANDARWGLERQVRLVAGSIVLTSVLASTRYRPLAAVAGFIGAGLTFSAVTNTCGMAMLLSRLPYNKGATCDVRDVISELTAANERATAARAS
ncbi:rhodanese-like domain-containing protein [Actinomarinicola tropica]|uniref:DUF2892 domain-containing protein n=1 Tax=Actinomarinicola tropica TaxID=2789776 RepID=A0A5Q2RFM0_9ACTN|nr:rhodanese-like domain-containing protein [Actinomarinicola tropica]QGG94444.1 DUF2892 domain-containing protein [Actinomarinicola tropica]